MFNPQAIHLLVHGYVQGVGFRYFTKTNATRFGIVGWVRNNYDGTVEIWGEGTKLRLEQFIQAVRRGPTHSQVNQLDIVWQSPQGENHTFNIQY